MPLSVSQFARRIIVLPLSRKQAPLPQPLPSPFPDITTDSDALIKEPELKPLIAEIESCKPEHSLLSSRAYSSLVRSLSKSYLLPQLREYAKISGLTRFGGSTKSNLIARIFKEVWGLRVFETQFDVREIQMASNRSAVSAHILDAKNLRALADTFHAKITIDSKKGILLIEAEKHNITALEEKIQSIISTLMSELVDISILPPVPQGTLPSVARLSSTFIEPLNSPVPTVRITSQRHSPENIAVAKRLLLTCYNDLPPKTHILPSSRKTTFFPVSDIDSWSWKHRNKDLVRWREEKSVIKDKDTDVEFNEDTLFIVGEEKKSWNEMFQDIIGSNVEATFGFSLFECIPRINQLTHTLHPVIPTNLQGSHDVFTYSFKLSFTPCPWSNTTKLDPLELEFEVDKETGRRHITLTQITKRQVWDILFPNLFADLRIVSTKAKLLDPTSVDEYLERSQLNPCCDKSFYTPPILNINSQTFLFTGLKYIKGMEYNVDGLALKNHKVDAGMSGGQTRRVGFDVGIIDDLKKWFNLGLGVKKILSTLK
ncbi:Protein sls1 [Neolecta irregularis DAH-3]|uniref:Protein sls1 n=1 Tax=Neolecta irregularis (strain DAH-3) TaxID=1198029 RepID=A0A1U7LL16_NEOID|nr:Protein sls1 [Neolecta irregularis DAH-3]|eukprot:OLL23356.1 Protein sls1 [Neolecta irregularis DAH-3]